MLSTLVIFLHVLVAIVLVVVVLLQSGKGAGLGAGFGGSSQSLFGSRGPANFLSKFTTASAIIFMFTSLMLSVISSKVGRTSIVDSMPSRSSAPAAGTATADPFKAVHETQKSGLPPVSNSGDVSTTEQKGQTPENK